jgi:cytochrome P450
MYLQEEKTMQPIRAFAQFACHHAKPESPLGLLRHRQSHNPPLDTHVASGASVSKEMLDETITMLFAGQDTSAATLSWALHLLSLYPDTLHRLTQEIDQVVQSESLSHEYNEKLHGKLKIPFTKKMISRMTYLDAVVKETMRLYPAAPFIVRRLQQDIWIPPESSSKTTHILPKDSFACIWIYSLHRNPRLWHNPNDFLPERWVDSTLREKDLGQKTCGAYIPFAAGSRNCLGQPLAHIILRIMLAKILYHCEIRDPRVEQPLSATGTPCTRDNENSDVIRSSRCCKLRQDMQAGFTILPLGGVQVCVNPRL